MESATYADKIKNVDLTKDGKHYASRFWCENDPSEVQIDPTAQNVFLPMFNNYSVSSLMETIHPDAYTIGFVGLLGMH